MIISASRRTDIPACYSEWFFNRIKEGYVLVRNPMNPHQVSRISLRPDVVDGIVFWSKNPVPMMDHLDLLKPYPYYFQFTLTPYGTDVERNLPSKQDVLLPAFQRLSDRIGPERVIWRYDPILLSETYPISYHLEQFGNYARRLSGYTQKAVISFLDIYRNTKRNMEGLNPRLMDDSDVAAIAGGFSSIAGEYGLQISTCCEAVDLEQYGITHASCIDRSLMESICGCSLDLEKDKNQRAECGCASSIDIGTYNTCKNGCRYCYANYSQTFLAARKKDYRPDSPLLCSSLTQEDAVKERITASAKDYQLKLSFPPPDKTL